MRTFTRFVLRLSSLALVAGLTACGGDDGDPDGGVPEQPQIFPENNPICLNRPGVGVGQTETVNVRVFNRGMSTLEITGADLVGDERMHFTFDPFVNTTVPFDEDGLARILYQPQEAGWDTVELQVMSNAQNFPRLDIFVLGRARPATLDAGTPWDAGPRPEAAGMACPDPDAGM